MSVWGGFDVITRAVMNFMGEVTFFNQYCKNMWPRRIVVFNCSVATQEVYEHWLLVYCEGTGWFGGV